MYYSLAMHTPVNKEFLHDFACNKVLSTCRFNFGKI